MELTWSRVAGAASVVLLLMAAGHEMQKQLFDFDRTDVVDRGNSIRALAVAHQVVERALQYPEAVNLGNDGPFPLGLCQGDCDNDEQCDGDDLVCHPREPGEDAPGCYLDSRRRDSPTDFCVSKAALSGGATGGDFGDGVVTGDGDGDSGVDGGSGSGSSSGSMGTEEFGLKLYWESGYFWQFERFERKWCIQCRSGCRSGVELSIFDCEQINPTDFRLIQYDSIGHEVQIRLSDENLCLEADTRNNAIFLSSCNSSDPNQRFISQGGNFMDGTRFEIVPKMKHDWCVTQKHHPKWNEVIYLEPCDEAREAQTSYWNKYVA